MTHQTYTVEQREHGIVISGRVPASDAIELLRKYEDIGLDLLDQRIADALDATLVVTDREGQKAWRANLGLEAE